MACLVMLITRAGVGVALISLDVAPGAVGASIACAGPSAGTSIAGSTAARPGGPGTPGASRACVRRRGRFMA